MHLGENRFKRGLQGDAVQYGLWVSLADSLASEIAASAGFDWLVIDAEHAPNDVRSLLHQLQALNGYPVTPIVRPLEGSAPALKQLLDLGAQTVLVPMVESAEQARELVRAVRYPPTGIRGVASSRAARWGRVDDYWSRADDEICLVVQIETLVGMENLESIATTEGVDAVFIGPSDLGAALGHLGDPKNPAVREAVNRAITRVRACGKPAGVLSVIPELAIEFTEAGANFVGIGVDTALLAKATSALLEAFQSSNG